MEFSTDIGHQITARKLMHILLYDNGCVNISEPDGLKRYPAKHFDRITKACEVFFEAHPDLLTDENIEEMAAGFEEDNEEKFGIYPEYRELNDSLCDYFDIM